MSRHRGVRNLDYDDALEEYDPLGESYDEKQFAMSPTTEAQFMYRRDGQAPQNFGPTLGGAAADRPMAAASTERVGGEDGGAATGYPDTLFSFDDVGEGGGSDMEQARLESAVSHIQSIVGPSVSQAHIAETLRYYHMDMERSVAWLLDNPQPHRAEMAQGGSGSAAAVPTATSKAKGKGPANGKDDQVLGKQALAFVRGPGDGAGKAKGKGKKATAASAAAAAEPAQRDVVADDMAALGLGELHEEQKLRQTAGGGPKSGTSTPRLQGGSKGGSLNNSRTSSPNPGPRVAKEGGGGGGRERSSSQSARRGKAGTLNVAELHRKRCEETDNKPSLNLVVIGHVDAGKSTLMGRLLYELQVVNQRAMHKLERDSKNMGKSSFAYAWVLDETGEERERGITMDVGVAQFETAHRAFTLLDAPGHRDFIPNMITGTAQADVAMLVVDAGVGGFEAGFEANGQTKEHALLARSLGVTQLLVAVNKLDTVEWARARFDEIAAKLGDFLRTAGFRKSDVTFVPCSGLTGENLRALSADCPLRAWYAGSTVEGHLDLLRPPARALDLPLRMCVSDVFKGTSGVVCVGGKLECGTVQVGAAVQVAPSRAAAVVRAIEVREVPVEWAVAGDAALLHLGGGLDITAVGAGNVVCEPGAAAVPCALRLEARIIVFDPKKPIIKGETVLFHYQSVSEPANVTKLVALLHKSSGEVLKRKPRALPRNSTAVVQITLHKEVPLELYKDVKSLGRFMLREEGQTIAAGVVTRILPPKRRDPSVDAGGGADAL